MSAGSAPEERGGEDPGSPRPQVHLPLALSKLPPGRHNLPREFILDNQRTRLVSAALGVFGERGFQKTSIAALIKEAGTSRSTFYALFSDKDECFLAAYELAIGWLEAAAREGAAASEDWPLQVRGATAKVLALLAEDPRLARLCAVEVHLAGPEASARHGQLVEQVSEALRPGRQANPEMAKLSSYFESLLFGGAEALIADAVLAGEAESLAGLAPDLTELLLTVYLGPLEARRVARRKR